MRLVAELDRLCTEVFLKCDEFERSATLKALFVTDELAPFVNSVPTTADNKKVLVSAVKAFLLRTQLRDGRALILPFVALLRDQYDPEYALYNELDNLLVRLQQHADGSDLKRVNPVTITQTVANTHVQGSVVAAATVSNSFNTYVYNDAKTSNTQSSLSDAGCDVVILTILLEEYQAVCSKIVSLQKAKMPTGKANLYAWKSGTIGEAENCYSVVVGMVVKAGNVNSASAALNAIELWKPRYVFLVGVAGGLKDLKQGDVAVADIIHGYEYGKVEGNFMPRDSWTYRVDQGLLAGIQAHKLAPHWLALIQEKPPIPMTPKLHVGEIASGEKVVDNPKSDFFTAVLTRWPKCIAVEMEGVGVVSAIENIQAQGTSVHFAMVRGISDVPSAEPESNNATGTVGRDNWKLYASDTAAAFAASYIAHGLPLPPKNMQN